MKIRELVAPSFHLNPTRLQSYSSRGIERVERLIRASMTRRYHENTIFKTEKPEAANSQTCKTANCLGSGRPPDDSGSAVKGTRLFVGVRNHLYRARVDEDTVHDILEYEHVNLFGDTRGHVYWYLQGSKRSLGRHANGSDNRNYG